MPAFIRTQKDEERWSKAKKAANKTHSESEGDRYWALVNHIYQNMKKAKDELEKARKRMSDEYDPNDIEDEDTDDLGEGFREFDPDEEDSAADEWLKQNDPEYQGGKYEEYDPDEDEEAHQRAIAEDLGDDEEVPEMAEQQPAEAGEEEGYGEGPDREPPTEEGGAVEPAQAPAAAAEAAPEQPQEVSGRKSRFRQPTREELQALRGYTRPWEQRAREAAALRADPSKNPELARHGNIIEARNQYMADRNAAYRALTSSEDYKNADPITQMEMDDNFEKEWHEKNPEHLKTAMTAHQEAHEKGKGARELHAAAKDAQIRNILAGGGHGGEGYSLEEGMQHAGGARGEEGTQATLKQDPATSFAMGNQDFVRQYAKDYGNKAKKVGNIDEMQNYNEGSKRDINRILGEAPMKDPKFEQFFQHYYPLIGMNARKTLARLGIDANHPDVDMSMLHEAGMHGLIQAINDYNHENPGKASFATHAANKIRGLQMTAMKNQDAIPTEVRQAQKRFAAQSGAPKASVKDMVKQLKHPEAAKIADRFKRIGSQRATQANMKIKPPKTGGEEGGGV